MIENDLKGNQNCFELRKVRVIKGSSYRESTVVNLRVGASVDSACQH